MHTRCRALKTKKMKSSLIIIGILIATLTNFQSSKKGNLSNENKIKVLAELISDEGGSKIQISKYRILKTIQGKITNDTIQVGYYFYNEFKLKPKTSILTLKKYNGNSKIKDYYIFPEYNPSKGIEKVKISTIDFKYWEGCETGNGNCNPLIFKRQTKKEKWYLVLPCGGTSTTVFLSQKEGIPEEEEIIQKNEISYSKCPPIFELTNLNDGKYYAYMLACGLGGQIEINLKTNME